MHSIIYGFTGCGKSTYLKSLIRVGRTCIDLDDYILRRYNSYSTLSKLIEDNGEEWFRKVEESSLSELLSRKSKIYLALGGGTVTESVISILQKKGVKGVYLKVSFEKCWQRIKDDKGRFIVRQGKKNCAQLYEQRIKLFNKMQGVLCENTVILDKPI